MSPSAASPTADEALSSLMGAVTATLEYSRLDPAHAATVSDWQPVQTAIYDYLEGYELRLDEGCYTPQEFERFLLVDAIAGLMEDDEFIDALYSAVTAARAAPAAGDAQTEAARDVLAERHRQITAEGWTPAHDDAHADEQLARAAACYALPQGDYEIPDPPEFWPWDAYWWKPGDRRRELIKAGALILAEIERLDRAAIAASQQQEG